MHSIPILKYCPTRKPYVEHFNPNCYFILVGQLKENQLNGCENGKRIICWKCGSVQELESTPGKYISVQS